MSTAPEWFQAIKKNFLFRFLSSIRLAIPTLATLAIVVGWGTILESRYGANYARWAIYEQPWFWVLLGLIGLNVLFAALSRIPYQRRHTGFVITHLGILILLGGSFMTAQWGIDGTLRLTEGSQGQSVDLPNLVFEAVSGEVYRKVRLPRGLTVLDERDLADATRELPFSLRLKRLLPFAEVDVEMRDDPQNPQQGTVVGFMLKSPMFQVAEWLHTRIRPEERMGPALFRLIEGELPAPQAVKARTKLRPAPPSAEGALVVLRVANGELVKKIPLSQLQKQAAEVDSVKIHLVRAYQRAIVSANHLTEGDEGKLNPALELNLEVGGQKNREVAYANFPQFSLHKEGLGGLRFEYQLAGPSVPEATAPAQDHDVAGDGEPRAATNLIEFAVSPASEQVGVRLLKAGQEVLRQTVSAGEAIQTPWMGMVLTLGSIQRGVVPADRVLEIEPQEKEPLPPGALQVAIADRGASREVWLREGESREVTVGESPMHLRFGSDHFNLPFRLRLQKFIKTDYPGSSLAQEYESHVEVDSTSGIQVISMNQPLKRDGYTLYQASYELGPGRPTVSILSVNRDPGRFWKYLGSLVMSLGIVIYTLHRSRLARAQRKESP